MNATPSPTAGEVTAPPVATRHASIGSPAGVGTGWAPVWGASPAVADASGWPVAGAGVAGAASTDGVSVASTLTTIRNEAIGHRRDRDSGAGMRTSRRLWENAVLFIGHRPGRR